MPHAARISDPTAHGTPLGAGPGSANVKIGGRPAWRALPSGSIGGAVEGASSAIQSLMSSASLTPASAAGALIQIQAKLLQAAGAASAQTNPAAAPTTAAALTTLNASNTALAATWTAASAVPGGMPAATAAYTQGLKAAMSAAATAAMSSMAGSADIHTCPTPCPAPPHGPGVVTRGSRTVRINGLPAARKDDQVFEACGGPDAISVGCASVNIGDLEPSAASGSDAESAPAASAADAAETADAPLAEGSPRQIALERSAALIRHQNRAAALAGRALCEVCSKQHALGGAAPEAMGDG